jgi:FkbM family methyltransferase
MQCLSSIIPIFEALVDRLNAENFNLPASLVADCHHRLEGVYLETLKRLSLAHDDIIIDIGAGFGSFAVPMALLFPQCQIYAYEPYPLMAAALERAIEMFELSNVKLLRSAFGIVPDKMDSELFLNLHEDGRFMRVHTKRLLGDFSHEPLDSELKNVFPAAIDRVKLLKIYAPGNFKNILRSFPVPVDCVTGEFWSCDGSSSEISAFLTKISNYHLVRYAEVNRLLWSFADKNPSINSNLSINISSPTKNLLSEVTAIVSCYNIGKYVTECVDSLVDALQGQGTILVVDDGSTDEETKENLELVKNEPGVRVLSKLNGGCASARNYGLNLTTSQFVTFIDGDDTVNRHFFTELLNKIVLENLDISECAFQKISESGELLETESRFEITNATDRAVCENMWELQLRQPSIWRRLYRREFLLQYNHFFPEHIRAYDDLQFQFLTMAYARKIGISDYVGYNYRLGREGQDVAASDERHFHHFAMYREMEKRLPFPRYKEDLMILDILKVRSNTWAYSNIRDDLKVKFLQHSFMDLFEGRSPQRIKNILWELQKIQANPYANGMLTICNTARLDRFQIDTHFCDEPDFMKSISRAKEYFAVAK